MGTMHWRLIGPAALVAAVFWSVPAVEAQPFPLGKQLERALQEAEAESDLMARRMMGLQAEMEQRFLEAFALTEVEKKANKGDAYAQLMLGRWNEAHGHYDVAVDWYRRAASQGYAEAQCDLGLMYAYGKGVPRDEALAVTWITRAADQRLPRAESLLGFMHVEGKGVPRNPVIALDWFRRAALQGDAE